MSDSLWPHGRQHARPPCPSPTPRVYPNSCPLSWWCHPTISSSVIPFSSHIQTFPGLESFQMNQLGSRIVEACLGEFWTLLYEFVRWVQLCGSLSIPWHCLSLGLEWKLTFTSPMATADFSKFAGTLSVALSQHHPLGFEIVLLDFCHLN